MSVIWGGAIHCYDTQSAVSYPAEIDDEFIMDDQGDVTGIVMGQPDGKLSFLIGCNFTTNLYRILRYVVHQPNRHCTGGSAVFDTLSVSSFSPQVVLDLLEETYSRLPQRFKETSDIGDIVGDRFNFQTANISASMQLVHIITLRELEDLSGEECYRVARDFRELIATIPPMYLRATSPPLVGSMPLS